MKLKIFLVVVFVAGLSVSLAMASPPEGKGKTGRSTTSSTTSTNKGKKPPKTGLNCRPKVSLILKGSLVSVSGSSLVMDVKQTNRQAAIWKGKQATVATDAKTKIRRRGNKATLATLVVGDRLNVQARSCKSERETAALLAARVVATRATTPANDGETTTTSDG
jgi:hypothetical protein